MSDGSSEYRHGEGYGHAHAHADEATHAHDGHAHHDEHEDHFHIEAMSEEDLDAIADAIWKLDHVELTTVGVDVGSSTSHLMFARVRLERRGSRLSSRFVVVGREVLWRSPILLTPYRPDYSIDAEQLNAFFHDAYRQAGLRRADVDSGAVILTGEALKRRNARAIADLFAEESGKFVCASAGHHLEALMAAHGSGAVALSLANQQTVLNVDIGGGTTKFALVRGGEVLYTAAVAVGGRLIARDEAGRLARIEEPALVAGKAAGVELRLGEQLSAEDEARLVHAFAEVLIGMINQQPPSRLGRELLVTEAPPLDAQPDAITFSGGVAEYLYGREQQEYADIARPLAEALRTALGDGHTPRDGKAHAVGAASPGRIPFPVLDPGEGIRATVIGASQFTVQVSGNTIFISDQALLPLRNLPVLYPRVELGEDISATEVAAEIENAARRFDLSTGDDHLALAFRWKGRPSYPRLRALADGVAGGMARGIAAGLPLVLLVDGDVARALGGILKQELGVGCEVVSIDGMQLNEFDYVDIGEVILPANVVPVVIKSLLFASSGSSVVAEVVRA